MYTLQTKPDSHIVMKNGSVIVPVATLINDCGSKMHITNDDHCYVLVLEGLNGICNDIYHWCDEAIEVLKTLPLPSTDERNICDPVYN